MKNFADYKILKSIIIALLALFTVLLNSFGQTDAYCYPSGAEQSTGRVDIYGKYDDVISVGNGSLGQNIRGWATFDVSDIPNNATIMALELRIRVQVASTSSNHDIDFGRLTLWPNQNTGSDVRNDIDNGTCYDCSLSSEGTSTGYKYITLNSSAISYFQNNSLDWNWFGVGMREYEENDDDCEIYGHSNSTYKPRLKVTYCLIPGTASISGPSPVCPGSTQTYSATATNATSYTWILPSGWSGSSTTNTITVTVGTSSGTIYVTPKNGSCTGTQCSKNVTVKTLSTSPTSASANPNDVCSESPVELTISGGSLGSGAEWYWYTGNCGGTFIDNDNDRSYTIQPTSTKKYYVRAEGDCNITSCASVTVTVTPEASIGSVSGTSPLCIGGTATYSASSVELGGGTGEWSSSNTNVATVISSGLVTAVGQGTSNIKYTITGGCGGIVSKYQQLTVNSNNTITLSSAAGTTNQDVCINSSIQTIRYSTTGATDATFTGLPDGLSGSWASNTVTITGSPSESGTFNYTVSLTGGCGNVSAIGTIKVNAANTISLISAAGTDNQLACINTPITNIKYSTTGATSASFSGLPSGVTGSWSANVVTISGTPTSAGVFNYKVTLIEGCGNVEASGTITVNPNNTVTITSATGTDNQTVCINTPITPITYSTTGATDATYSGFPTGVSGTWSGNTITISGTPSVSGTFNYTVSLTGGCGDIKASGTITVNPDNTINLTSGSGSNNRYACINTTMTPITYSTINATGAEFAGMPTGITGSWLSNVVTISGTPSEFGSFNYIVTLKGGCGSIKAEGTITVNPDNTIVLTSAPGTIDQNLCINTPITPITYSTTGATDATYSGLPAGVSGIWSVNTVTISGTPAESGTFNYTVTLTGGCGIITTGGKITVKPDNTITLTSASATDNQTVCINTPITTITYSTTGAINAVTNVLPAGVTGVWSGNVVTISGTPIESGTWTYKITLTGGCGNIEKAGTVIVKPDNTIMLTSNQATEDQTVCVNAPILNIKYSTTVATGASFTGLPPGVTGSWAANVVTISGVPSSSGIYNYVVETTEGCSIARDSGILKINPRPSITSIINGSHCGPGKVTLEATPGSGTVNWYTGATGGSAVATGSGFITPDLSASRDYYVDATADGCTTESRTALTATIFSIKVPEIVLKWNDVLICSNADNLITSYQWIKDDTDIPSENKQYFVTSKISGDYKVRIIDINGCEIVSSEITIAGSKSLILYPNPSKGSLTISLNEESTGEVVINIITENGIILKHIKTEKAYPDFIYEIPVSDLDEGAYFIRLTVNNTSLYHSKILVIK